MRRDIEKGFCEDVLVFVRASGAWVGASVVCLQPSLAIRSLLLLLWLQWRTQRGHAQVDVTADNLRVEADHCVYRCWKRFERKI